MLEVSHSPVLFAKEERCEEQNNAFAVVIERRNDAIDVST